MQWRTEGGGVGVFKHPPPEIPKISVESKGTFHTNRLTVAYLVSEFKPTPTSRKFDKVKPDCKLSGKFLMFLLQHPN